MQNYSQFGKIAFLLLSVFLLFFYSMSFFQAGGIAQGIFFAVLIFLIAGILIQSVGAIKTKKDSCGGTPIIFAATFGAAATFILSTMFFGSVIAASIVGLVYAAYANRNEDMKSLSGAVYCGAFVGMSSDMFAITEIVFAGLAAGLIQTLPRKEYDGIGGTLGTIAFIATYITSKILMVV